MNHSLTFSAGTVPQSATSLLLPENGLDLEHPAVEDLPEFLSRIDPSFLTPACRNFNGSLCEFDGRRLMAYRSEDYRGMNHVFLGIMNEDFAVVGNVQMRFGPESGVHYEDPRLTVVAGRLHLIVAHVKFGPINTCRQRLFVLNSDTLQPEEEISLPFGVAGEGRPEKNWMPFELPGGDLGLIYSHRPHLVIEVTSRRGHETPGLTGWRHTRMLNGRTPPVRVDDDLYFAFFGGHVRHPYRGSRYMMGAYVFSARPPYGVIAACPEPLAWGSEASPTIFSSRPNSGHPPCIYPAGVARERDDLIVSCGVNDSYVVLMRYSFSKLMQRMLLVDEYGGFVT